MTKKNMKAEEVLEMLETEYGIFTNNIATGQTAEEVYQEWLADKANPKAPELSEVDKLKKKLKDLEDRVGKIDKIKVQDKPL